MLVRIHLISFMIKNQTIGYDVIIVNVFHFTLMRFHFKKEDNSVPPILLAQEALGDLGQGNELRDLAWVSVQGIDKYA